MDKTILDETEFKFETVNKEQAKKLIPKIRDILYPEINDNVNVNVSPTIFDSHIGSTNAHSKIPDMQTIKVLLVNEINKDFVTINGKKIKINRMMFNKKSKNLKDEGNDGHNKNALAQFFKNNDIDTHVTFGFTKLYEILVEFKIIQGVNLQKIRTFHICEAPGGFIFATNYAVAKFAPDKEFDWNAQTLNPWEHFEDMRPLRDQYGLIKKYRKKYHFGADNTGNIINPVNIKYYINHFKFIDLVTADCAFEYSLVDPDQESRSAMLYIAQAITAIGILGNGGIYIFKMFTFTNEVNIALLLVLRVLFDSLKFVKPITSKSGSAEIYIVCIGFKKALFTNKVKNKLLEYYDTIYSTGKLFPVIDMSKIPINFIKKLQEIQWQIVLKMILFLRLRRLEIKFPEFDIQDKQYIKDFVSEYVHYYEYTSLPKNKRLL